MKKLLFFSLLFFSFFTIMPEAGAVTTCPGGGAPLAGVCVPTSAETGLSGVTVYKVLTTVIEWITYIFASIAIIVFVLCGLKYLLSVGDDTAAGEAKKCMTFAVIGVIVAGSAFIVIKTVATILKGSVAF